MTPLDDPRLVQAAANDSEPIKPRKIRRRRQDQEQLLLPTGARR